MTIFSESNGCEKATDSSSDYCYIEWPRTIYAIDMPIHKGFGMTTGHGVILRVVKFGGHCDVISIRQDEGNRRAWA